MEDSFKLGAYVPFISDYGFKVTFGNEKNTLFLRVALQALIQDLATISEVWLDKNTLEGFTKESRSGIIDVFCKDDQGHIFIVEMQLATDLDMLHRMKFYAYHKMEPYLHKGLKRFNHLPRIFCIAILGYNLLPGSHYHSIVGIRDEAGHLLDKQMVYVFAELEKFQKKPELCTTDLDKLLYLMKELHHLTENEQAPVFTQEDWINAAIRELETGKLTPEQRSDLSIALVKEISIRSREETAYEHFFQKGIEQGIEQGKQIQLEQLIRQLIASTDWSDQKIAQVANVPEALVRSLRNT